MMRRLERNFNSVEDILLFIRIFIWISLIAIMLKLFSFSKLMGLLNTKRPKTVDIADRLDLIYKVLKYTDFILGRNWWIYRMNCLKRSLVLFKFFRLYGIDVKICMGVRKERASPAFDLNANLQGHAWLMINGKPFLENRRSMTTAYTPVYFFPQRE